LYFFSIDQSVSKHLFNRNKYNDVYETRISFHSNFFYVASGLDITDLVNVCICILLAIQNSISRRKKRKKKRRPVYFICIYLLKCILVSDFLKFDIENFYYNSFIKNINCHQHNSKTHTHTSSG